MKMKNNMEVNSCLRSLVTVSVKGVTTAYLPLWLSVSSFRAKCWTLPGNISDLTVDVQAGISYNLMTKSKSIIQQVTKNWDVLQLVHIWKLLCANFQGKISICFSEVFSSDCHEWVFRCRPDPNLSLLHGTAQPVRLAGGQRTGCCAGRVQPEHLLPAGWPWTDSSYTGSQA